LQYTQVISKRERKQGTWKRNERETQLLIAGGKVPRVEKSHESIWDTIAGLRRGGKNCNCGHSGGSCQRSKGRKKKVEDQKRVIGGDKQGVENFVYGMGAHAGTGPGGGG